jgi:hypothetical protein
MSRKAYVVEGINPNDTWTFGKFEGSRHRFVESIHNARLYARRPAYALNQPKRFAVVPVTVQVWRAPQ